MSKWTKIAKVDLSEYSTLQEFLEDIKDQDEPWDDGTIPSEIFKKEIPSDYRMISSELQGEKFDKAMDFFKIPNTEIADPGAPVPNIIFGEVKKFEKDGYKAILEGEMTWGLWVSPEFIEKVLPKI